MAPAAGRWLPFGTRPDARLRLFCLPHAGAGASTYRKWAEGLPEWLDVCPVQPPGRETRVLERPFDRAGRLAAALAEQLEGELGMPYAIFGHSVGALVAFELAHRLPETACPPPVHLFVSGRRAPQLPDRHAPLRDLSLDELADRLRELGGTSEEVLRDRRLLEFITPLLRADFAVNETYDYVARPPLAVPITVFGATRDPRADRAGLAAWQVQTNCEFHLDLLDGGHFAVLEQAPLVHERVVATLRDALRTAGEGDVVTATGKTNAGEFDRYSKILRRHLPYAGDAPLPETGVLAELGLDSLGTVRLLADLEGEFDVELPDDALTEETFKTVGSLWRALRSGPPAPAGT
ncbi:thioesterase domain-containing protein [Amycolatopsis sp. GM8]|uniref:thioesterase domain-containing protein n=1 Tax=Amycolatopsis sp. GM8 TaxID=2896530 RepID=UPI001EFFC5E5|nr:thioesterase domain-containing protein [Amycolatopsis sp. GM8]